MIAGILPSGNGYPWAPTGMTTERWRTMPVRVFAIRELHVTQPGVLFDAVFNPTFGPIRDRVGGTNKDGPRRCWRTVPPGPRRLTGVDWMPHSHMLAAPMAGVR